MRRIPALSTILALIASMTVTLMLSAGVASAAPGDPAPDLNIKPDPGDPATVSQVPQATWQTNGIVWAMEHVNGVVYVGGNFSQVRPPGAPKGQQEQPRKNMAAFDAKTGELLPFTHDFTAPTFNYDPNAQRPDTSCNADYTAYTYTCDTVYEIRKSPDGSKIYVGGDFANVDGKDRRKLAAFNVSDGGLDEGFKPAGTDRRVRSLAVSAEAVYAGGSFTTTAGQPRIRLAAFNRVDGALLPWAPRAEGPGSNGGIIAMTMSPDQSRVIIGGEFVSLNGRGIQGVDAVNTTDGASMPWEWRGIRGKTFVTDLTIDANTVYVSGESRTFGEFEGRAALDPMTGQARWVDMCKGATWAIAVIGNVLYSGSHAHDCSTTPGGFGEIYNNQADPKNQRLLAQTTEGNSTRILKWYPNTNGGDYSLAADRTPSRLGPRTMTAAGDTLWVGGQFTRVNGAPQQSLTRFAPEAGQAVPAQPGPAVPPEPNPVPKGAEDLPPIDNGTFPGGPAPDGRPDPGVDNQPAPGAVGGAERPDVQSPGNGEPADKPGTPGNGNRLPVGNFLGALGGGNDNTGVGNDGDNGKPDHKPRPDVEKPNQPGDAEPTERPRSTAKVDNPVAAKTGKDGGGEVAVTKTPKPNRVEDRASSDDLPVTGTSLTWSVLIAVALVAVGAVLVFAGRRRSAATRR